MTKLPLHLQSIMHIINNYDFVYEDNHVRATVDVYLDAQELKDLRTEFQTKLTAQTNPEAPITDAERQGYIDGITEINLALSELRAN
jgi:hypothetical protein